VRRKGDAVTFSVALLLFIEADYAPSFDFLEGASPSVETRRVNKSLLYENDCRMIK
jgi:hypothetical protein